MPKQIEFIDQYFDAKTQIIIPTSRKFNNKSYDKKNE